jgi:AraC-like DNA-binding protein
VLDPGRAKTAFRVSRYEPAPDLLPLIRHYWVIRWDLGDAVHRQGTLSVPSVNAVVEAETDGVSGAWTRRFDRALTGAGVVFGALFQFAGFQPFFGRSMHELTDRSVPFSEVFRGDPVALRLALRGASDVEAVERLNDYYRAEGAVLSPEGAAVGRQARLAERDPTIGRAEVLAERAGVSLRTLQRGFRRHLGVSPKTVVRRFRLMEASARLSAGSVEDQAELAFLLGYADQAHFVRDFSAVVGSPPGRYAAAQRR